MGFGALPVSVVLKRDFVWFIDGTLATGDQQGPTLFPKALVVPKSVKLYSETAPDGADLIIDIEADGTTIFSTKPQIDDGENEGGGDAVFDVSSIAADAKLTANIDQVGSGTAGEDLTIQLQVTQSE